jgi:hypothetical protein
MLLVFTAVLVEFSNSSSFNQFWGIYFFSLVNSVIQLVFKDSFFNMKFSDNFPLWSTISLMNIIPSFIQLEYISDLFLNLSYGSEVAMAWYLNVFIYGYPIFYSRHTVILPMFQLVLCWEFKKLQLELIYWRNTIAFVYRWILLLDIY